MWRSSIAAARLRPPSGKASSATFPLPFHAPPLPPRQVHRHLQAAGRDVQGPPLLLALGPGRPAARPGGQPGRGRLRVPRRHRLHAQGPAVQHPQVGRSAAGGSRPGDGLRAPPAAACCPCCSTSPAGGRQACSEARCPGGALAQPQRQRQGLTHAPPPCHASPLSCLPCPRAAFNLAATKDWVESIRHGQVAVAKISGELAAVQDVAAWDGGDGQEVV
jgi:hypothetical protein